MRQTAELVSGHKSAVVLLLHSVFTYKVYFFIYFSNTSRRVGGGRRGGLQLTHLCSES